MSPQDRRTLRIGLVGFVVAVTLILGAWRIVASDLPDFRATAALPGPTPTSEPTASRTPSETFVVPSPPPVTPTVSESLAPLVPEVAAPPTTQSPAVAAPPAPPAPPVARGATPSRGQPAPADPQVRGLDLSCTQNGRRVAATLSFVATGPVPISVTAGGRTQTSRGSGAVGMHVSAPGGERASCTAVVAGRQIGPIPAFGRG